MPVFTSFDAPPGYAAPTCVSASVNSVALTSHAQQAGPVLAAVVCTDTANAHVPVALPACRPTSLTDPSFKDLDEASRRYLAHFADRVCRDLAAHDGPGCNPFRELIPLALKHPFLLHIITATSAVHMSNISHPKITASSLLARCLPTPSTTTGSSSPLDPAAHLQYLRSTDGISRRAFLDSLVAKQKAIRDLRAVLQNPESADGGVLLAAVLFFVNFELIDLGRSGWQTHLHGACRILNLLTPESDLAKVRSRTALQDCIVSDFVIYHILGSTLTCAGLGASIARHALDLLPVMERVVGDSYLCCPPTILHIILSASQLSGDATGPQIPDDVTTSALQLIERALAFDIHAWAVGIQSQVKVPDLPSRASVASAHRSAVCLYILRAIPSTRAHAPITVDELVADIFRHLDLVDENDEHFKATSWPTVIAGAESQDREAREWVLGRLLKLWECCPWGYVFAAMDMLKRTWRMRDEEEGMSDGVGWLQELWARDMGFLIV